MSLSLVTAPTVEPLTLDQAKSHLRVTVDDDDALIGDILIPATRERAELATRRQLITATWNLVLDAFPLGPAFYEIGRGGFDWWINEDGALFLDVPKPPLQSVLSITYTDTAGVTQTWDPSQYVVEAPSGPRCARGRIAPAYGVVWPFTLPQITAVTVQFRAGYGDGGNAVPALLKAAQLMDMGTLYEHREAVLADNRAAAIEIPSGTASIYRSHKSYALTRPRR